MDLALKKTLHILYPEKIWIFSYEICGDHQYISVSIYLSIYLWDTSISSVCLENSNILPTHSLSDHTVNFLFSIGCSLCDKDIGRQTNEIQGTLFFTIPLVMRLKFCIWKAVSYYNKRIEANKSNSTVFFGKGGTVENHFISESPHSSVEKY